MPPLEKVLAAVADARLKHRDEIVRARVTKKQDEAKRRESGEDKREFEEILKQDWLEFDLCSQAIQVSYDSVRGARGQIRSILD